MPLSNHPCPYLTIHDHTGGTDVFHAFLQTLDALTLLDAPGPGAPVVGQGWGQTSAGASSSAALPSSEGKAGAGPSQVIDLTEQGRAGAEGGQGNKRRYSSGLNDLREEHHPQYEVSVLHVDA